MDVVLTILAIVGVLIGLWFLVVVGLVFFVVRFIGKALVYFDASETGSSEVSERQRPMGPGGTERRSRLGAKTDRDGKACFW
jgi:hypothetical protein